MLMDIRVRVFSIVKELAGLEQLAIEMKDGERASDIVQHLAAYNDSCMDCETTVRIAVNNEYVDGWCELHNGDEVVTIPPASGQWNRKQRRDKADPLLNILMYPSILGE